MGLCRVIAAKLRKGKERTINRFHRQEHVFVNQLWRAGQYAQIDAQIDSAGFGWSTLQVFLMYVIKCRASYESSIIIDCLPKYNLYMLYTIL